MKTHFLPSAYNILLYGLWFLKVSKFECPENDSKITVNCTAGTYRSSEMTTCTRCDTNSISKTGATECTVCEAGTVSNGDNTECGV